MKILIAAQFYPPDLGGEERHADNLALVLAARGHDVEVITSALPQTGAGTTEEEGLLVHRVRTTAQRFPLHTSADRPHATPFPDLAMRNAIDALLREKKFDVVHAHNWIVNSTLAPARRNGVALVLTLHDYSHLCVTKRLVHRGSQCSGPELGKCLSCAAERYGKLVGPATVSCNAVVQRARERQIAQFITVSRVVAIDNRLAERGLSFEVIPNFIPDDLVTPSPPRPEGPIVFAGDLTAEKGVAVLLEAFGLLSPRPELALIGRGGDELAALGLPKTRFVGPLEHAKVMPLLAAARFVVVPSVMPDPCPTVVLEAMAHARAVVASANGGIVDLVEDGVTGLLVTPNDPVALAQAIGRFEDKPALAAAMGAAALRRVQLFTASAIVERVEAVYRTAVAGAPRSAAGTRIESSAL